MSFSVEIRGIDELTDDPEDPLRDHVINAYDGHPITGSRDRQTSYQFSYEALPPKRLRQIIGDLGNDDSIGLIEEVPATAFGDSFLPAFFSVPKLAREVAARYPEIATRSLDEVYSGYAIGQLNDEQVLASVLIDFARHPPSGFPVVVFTW